MVWEQKMAPMVAEADLTVGDGSVDYKGRPAIKAETGGWKTAPFNFVICMSEITANYGVQINLVTYLVATLNFAIPKAANVVTNFVGTQYMLSVLGGLIADSCLGKFWTAIIFGLIESALSLYVIIKNVCQYMYKGPKSEPFLRLALEGMVLLAYSASEKSLRPAACLPPAACEPASTKDLAFFYTALYLVGLGGGCFKPCLAAHGAEQFNEKDVKERTQSATFFNYFFVSLIVGALLGVTLLVWIQDNVGRAIGWAISAAFLVFGLVGYACGITLYRNRPPEASSPIARIAQVWVAACRNIRVPLPTDESLLYETSSQGYQKIKHTKQLRFLDKAAITPLNHGPKDVVGRWRLCTVTQVEEAKQIVRMLAVWSGTIVQNCCQAQLSTFSIIQGTTMDRKLGKHFEFPPASLTMFALVVMILLVPLYDKFFVPFARRFTGHPRGITSLQRISVGLILCMVAMAAAALTEKARIEVARSHQLLDSPSATVPMTVFWLVPQFFIFGLADMFTYIGCLEFFYDEAPMGMKSVGTSLYLASISVGFFLSSGVVSAVNAVTGHYGKHPHEWLQTLTLNRSRLSDFYWFLGVLSVFNFAFFLLAAWWYKYKELPTADLNNESKYELSNSTTEA